MDWPPNTRRDWAGRFAAPTFRMKPGSKKSSSRWACPNMSNSISSRWLSYTAPDDTSAPLVMSNRSPDNRRQRWVITLPSAPTCSPDSASMHGSHWCPSRAEIDAGATNRERAARCRRSGRLDAASGSAVLDLVERHAAVGGVLARKSQYPFANDVARHLSCTAAERRGLSGQVAFADEHQLGGSVHNARATGDRQRRIDLERHFLGLERPDQRAPGRGEGSVQHTPVDVVDQLLPHRAVRQGPAGQPAGPLVVGEPGRAKNRVIIGGLFL